MDIDEILDKAKYAVNTAAKKAEEVVEVSKLKFETAKYSNAATDLYEKLGRAVYDGKKNGFSNDELISSICAEIDEKNKSIDDLESKIADKKNQSVCPACGCKNSKDSCYCTKCGTKIKSDFDANDADDEPMFTDTVKEKAHDFAKKAMDIEKDVSDKAKDFADSFKEKHMPDGAREFVKDKMEDVKDKFDDVVDDIKGKTDDAANKAADVADDLKEKAADAAEDVADEVKDKAADVAEDLNNK